MTVEINYSDAADDAARSPARTVAVAQLALLLRARTLVDVDCWSNVPGQPIPPGAIVTELGRRLAELAETTTPAAKPPRVRKRAAVGAAQEGAA